jgi:hypothetical protein
VILVTFVAATLVIFVAPTFAIFVIFVATTFVIFVAGQSEISPVLSVPNFSSSHP